MNKYAFITRVKQESRSFFKEVSKTNECIYLILFTLHVITYLMMKLAFNSDLENVIDNVRYGILSIVIWGSATYLFFIIAAWKNLWNKNVLLILVGGGILAITFYFSRHMSTNSYGLVLDGFFCVMAYGKDYRKILRCTLCSTFILLLLAGIGVPAGYTLDLVKPNNIHLGHSFGTVYPNTY